MKKIRFIILLLLTCFVFLSIDATHAQEWKKRGTQVVVKDPVADPRSRYTARYIASDGRSCTAFLIAKNVALTAKHCGGESPSHFNGTIYPAASGDRTPLGYMNVRDYVPNPKYDLALLKGEERDQDPAYKYYIDKFKMTIPGYTDQELVGYVGKDIYSYGYPGKYRDRMQYRSDGKIYHYQKNPLYLRTTMPGYGGQSGSVAFLKDSTLVGVLVTRTQQNLANVLPFTKDIAKWINDNAN